jgi:hypothetical protein
MRADLIARDRDGRPVLVVEVKTRPATPADLDQLRAYLDAGSGGADYGMLVDPESIWILSTDGQRAGPTFGPFRTTDVLKHYHRDSGSLEAQRGGPRLFGLYLETLVSLWLQDLAFPWFEGEPPLRNELAEAGLLQRLEDSTVAEEEAVRDDSLR